MGAAGHGEGSGRWWAGDMVARAAGRGGVRLDGGLLEEEDDRQRGRERGTCGGSARTRASEK